MNIKRIFFLLLLLNSVLYCQPISTVRSNLSDIENYDTEYITMVVLYWIDSKRFDKIEFLKDLIDFHR